VVTYVCTNCGKDVEEVLVTRKIRCPHCSNKTLMKKQQVVHTVKAR